MHQNLHVNVTAALLKFPELGTSQAAIVPVNG